MVDSYTGWIVKLRKASKYKMRNDAFIDLQLRGAYMAFLLAYSLASGILGEIFYVSRAKIRLSFWMLVFITNWRYVILIHAHGVSMMWSLVSRYHCPYTNFLKLKTPSCNHSFIASSSAFTHFTKKTTSISLSIYNLPKGPERKRYQQSTNQSPLNLHSSTNVDRFWLISRMLRSNLFARSYIMNLIWYFEA